MTTRAQEIEQWLLERPKWMQDAARRIVANDSFQKEDVPDLTNICVAEANERPFTFSGLPKGALEISETTKPLHLDAISSLRGINALTPKKPLIFGKTQLCIVYGGNGAGKSGYVRLLKNACGCRGLEELLPNVFEKTTEAATAQFSFTLQGKALTIGWNSKPISQLSGVDIYDTDSGFVYIDGENEVTFEPRLLRLFSELTEACELLKAAFQDGLKKRIEKKPLFPAVYADTAAERWYANLRAETPSEEVEVMTTWSDADERDFEHLNRRLAEKNPATAAEALRRQANSIKELVNTMKSFHARLSDAQCEVILAAKNDSIEKRKAADEDAKKAFEKAPLEGIGTQSWRILWEAARTYSTQYAYKDDRFPNVKDGARCLLCQQDLAAEGRDRYTAFENFVRGELQNQARTAEQAVEKLIKELPETPSAQTLKLLFSAAGINATEKTNLMLFVEQLAVRRGSCVTAKANDQLSGSPERSILVAFARSCRGLLRRARNYELDAKNENRPQLEKTLKELGAKKWLNQQREAIQEEISRLNEVKRLLAAESLTNTRAISIKKSAVAEELITCAYIKRFLEELKLLNAAHIPVELKKSRTSTGRVYHKLFLKNCVRPGVRASEILSEGEFRIISLAAFLADTRGRGTTTPFIFDDPISSLDQFYEEATAQRLVELCKTRQVIVFTHRLSLVSLLEKYSEKVGIENTLVCLSRFEVGDIAEIPINLSKTMPAANRLLNERLKRAKVAAGKGDAEYEIEAKALCGDVRVLVEHIVERDLINGIVRRHSAEVQTKNRIYALSRITAEDCTFVDDLMTKYSRYEHSQSEEAPVELPKPDELENDLKSIVAFIKTVQDRSK